MVIKAAINGFGRVGRLVCRAALANPQVEIVAINSTASPATIAHLLTYDSAHGRLEQTVSVGEDYISVGGQKILISAERELGKVSWGALGVDVVIESSGKFNDANLLQAHIAAGAKKVLVTASCKNSDVTIVMGVNENQYDPGAHHIVSNASCTTNCLAPVAKVIHEQFGIVRGLMTTVHAYTNDQRILDGTHKDLRRARTAGVSIIPTTTGAAKAVAKVLPELQGKLNGMAMRVPVQNVSVVDFVVELEKSVSAEEVNAALKAVSEQQMKGIIRYCDLPLVSTDFNGDPHSTIVDALSTMVIGDNLVKIVLWYDNEWGYSCRIADLLQYMGERL